MRVMLLVLVLAPLPFKIMTCVWIHKVASDQSQAPVLAMQGEEAEGKQLEAELKRTRAQTQAASGVVPTSNLQKYAAFYQ